VRVCVNNMPHSRDCPDSHFPSSFFPLFSLLTLLDSCMCFTDSSLPHHWRPRAEGGVGEELMLVLYIVCVGLIVGVVYTRI
jgi:hypothetical protein